MNRRLSAAVAASVAIAFLPLTTQVAHADEAQEECEAQFKDKIFATQAQVDECIASLRKGLEQDKQKWRSCMEQYGSNGEEYCGSEPKIYLSHHP